MILFADLIRKGQPGVTSVHARTALGNGRKRKGKPDFSAFIKGDTLDWSLPLDIKKADPDQQLVFGWASVIEKNGVVIIDKQGDVIEPAELEKAAYDFVLYSRDHGDMHQRTGVGQMVESIVFTIEKQQALGIDLGQVGWFVGFKVTDDAFWKRIKAGDLPEFSIGGSAVREMI